jgi:hypothetical protein
MRRPFFCRLFQFLNWVKVKKRESHVDLTHMFLGVLILIAIIVSSVSITLMVRYGRDISATQRAIFLFMQQKFGDLEELMKSN